MDFYYVVFSMPEIGRGSTVIRQIPGPDGFNVAGAYSYLLGMLNVPILIESWTQVTEKRYNEFQLLLKSQQGATKPKFGVVPGAGEGSDKGPGALTVVKPLDPGAS